MRKDIRVVDESKRTVQITTLDERFYAQPVNDPATGLPRYEFRPSVTWICDYYPKGAGFSMWLKKNGEDSDQIARLAANRGYMVHRAVAQLNAGSGVKLSDQFCDDEGRMRELTPDETFAVLTYAEWWSKEGKLAYDILGFEYTIWPDAEALAAECGKPADAFLYAGTVDMLVRRKADNTRGIIDIKTSADIWPSHKMQVSAYRVAERADWAAILQLAYYRTKRQKFKFTEVEDCFDLFCHTKAIWKHENEGVTPKQQEFPLEIKL